MFRVFIFVFHFYCHVNVVKSFGRLHHEFQEFVSMINALHDNNIKVLIELNVLFTSEQHEW